MSDAQILEGLELSEEVRDVLVDRLNSEQDELAQLRAEARERDVSDRLGELKEQGFSDHPGFLKEIETLLRADSGSDIVTFSEGKGSEVSLSVTDIVNRLIDALPKKEDGKVDFGEQAEDLGADKPPVDASNENKSVEERVEAARDFLGVNA